MSSADILTTLGEHNRVRAVEADAQFDYFHRDGTCYLRLGIAPRRRSSSTSTIPATTPSARRSRCGVYDVAAIHGIRQRPGGHGEHRDDLR